MDYLFVPDDIRSPKFGFESIGTEDDDLVVVFEDGTIGTIDDPDKANLSGGSRYVRRIGDIKDILKEPEFQEGTIDTEELAEKYYRNQIPIFTISIILLLAPLIDGRLFLARYEMSFLLLPISLIFAYSPEFILFRKIRNGKPSRIILDIGEESPVELSSFGKASKSSKGSQTVRSGPRYFLGFVILAKAALPISTIEGSVNAFDPGSGIAFLVGSLFLIPILSLWAWIDTRRGPLHGEVKVKHASLREVYEFIREKWISGSLETISGLISEPEGQHLEFKSSIWTTYRNDTGEQVIGAAKNEKTEGSIIKTIAAFLNTYGGKLIIGVQDKPSRRVVGIEPDFEYSGLSKDIESFQNSLSDIICSSTKEDTIVGTFVKIDVESIEEKMVCIVTVRKRQPESWTYVDLKNWNGKPITDAFFVRNGPQSKLISSRASADEWKRSSEEHRDNWEFSDD